jgi:thiamine-phosphate pyrophosphorylase
MMVDIRLYALVDPARANGRPLPELTRQVVAGGATLIHLRERSARRSREAACRC